MDELRRSAFTGSGDDQCREVWSWFYNERRRRLIRLFWLAGGMSSLFRRGFFVTFDERTAMFDEDLGDWISVGIYDAQS
jgi:hypothetical protein